MSPLPSRATPTVPVPDLSPAPSLRLIDRDPPSLRGRSIGVIIEEGSSARLVSQIQEAVRTSGAKCVLVARTIGGVILDDGSKVAGDAQLAGTPSVFFDAVAVIVPAEGARALSTNPAVQNFLRDAFHHLKAIGVDEGGSQLLDQLGIERDTEVVDLEASGISRYLEAATTRAWGREPQD